jgi:hypothetical protein
MKVVYKISCMVYVGMKSNTFGCMNVQMMFMMFKTIFALFHIKINAVHDA